ncbi:MAG: hypothetical protein ACRDQW_01060 [Haloechinothrix sp.]
MTAGGEHPVSQADPVSETAQRTPSPLLQVALVSFVVGLLFVLAVFLLFALGHTDLPWWLSTAAIGFTSAGFGFGLITLLREARGR